MPTVPPPPDYMMLTICVFILRQTPNFEYNTDYVTSGRRKALVAKILNSIRLFLGILYS